LRIGVAFVKAKELVMKNSISHLCWGLLAVSGMLLGLLGCIYHFIMPSVTATSLMAIGFVALTAGVIAEFTIFADSVTGRHLHRPELHRRGSAAATSTRAGTPAYVTIGGLPPQFANSIDSSPAAMEAARDALKHGAGGHHHGKHSRRADMTPEEFARWWAQAGQRYRDTGDLLRD
jgi:hypothetical protein